MIVVYPKKAIEIAIQKDRSLQIREYGPDDEFTIISIKSEDVIKFKNAIIDLLENYNG